MSKILIIAEKPSLAKTIVEAVGGKVNYSEYYENSKYIITSQFGHLLELKSIGDYMNEPEKDKKWDIEDLPYIPLKFEYKIKNDSGINKRYETIKKLIKRDDVVEIVNAGDPDREGETLVNIVIYRIFDELHFKKKVTRIWLDPLTEEKVIEELNNRKPIDNTSRLFEEGKARAYLDWLYGINLTRYNSLKVGKIMNTGRVIIPLVKWVYDRDFEINNFKEEKYFEIQPIIQKDGKQIKLQFKDLKFKENQFDIAKETMVLLKDKKIKVSKIEKKEVSKEPKKLFSLSTLQTYMFQREKINISKTLELVQSLYEKGYLTYPRTDTEYLSEEEKNKVKSILKILQNDDLEFKDSKKIFDSNKVESHTAIIITTKIPNLESLSKDEKKVYLTVRNRFFANFVKEKCILNKTIVTFEFENMREAITGTTIRQKGYLKYENDIENTYLPEFKINEEFIVTLNLLDKETTPPQHISEYDLIKLCKNPFKDILKEETEENDNEEYKNILEGSQIGTEATRAAMIEKIKKIGYVKVERNRLLITEYGIKFIETLILLNENLWKEKTVEMNKKLKKINSGEISVKEVIEDAKAELKKIINVNIKIEKLSTSNNKKILGKCPKCGGDIIENTNAYNCTKWKEGCDFTIWKKISGKVLTNCQVKQLLNEGITSQIKGFKSKSGKDYNAWC